MKLMRRLPYIILMLLSGCATEQLKIERGLVAARFDQRKIDTPERKASIAEFPPYTFVKMTKKNKEVNYLFVSPARKTAFFGDEAAMKRYVAYLTAQQQSNQMRAAESQRKWANVQQNLLAGAAMGSMMAAQQPTYYAPSYQPPPSVDVGAAFGRTTRYQPDSLGGFTGSDGTRIKPDGLGGYNVTTY